MNKMKLIAVMILWGSVGLFAKTIDIGPFALAFYRSLFSLPLLFLLGRNTKGYGRMDKKTLKWVILSGVLIGFAWVFLFTAYKQTSIARNNLL